MAMAPQSKTCRKCGMEKLISEFYFRKDNGTHRTECKKCIIEIVSNYVAGHKDQKRETNKKWLLNNRDKVNAAVKKWADNNREYQRYLCKEWAKNNPARHNAKGARQRAAMRNASPAWANREAIEKIYEEARIKTIETGIRHEVDHYYPIKGRTVSGLHVEANLRVIPMLENRIKHNHILTVEPA